MTDLSLLHHARSRYGPEFLLLAAFFYANDFGYVWLNHMPDYLYNFHIIQLVVITFFIAMISRPDRGAFNVPAQQVYVTRMLAYAVGACAFGLACHYAIGRPLADFPEIGGWYALPRIASPDTAIYDLTIVFIFSAIADEVVFRRMAIQWLETKTTNRWFLVLIPSSLFGLSLWGAGVDAVLEGVVFATILTFIYLQVRRLWPVVLANYGTNVILYGPDSYSSIKLPF
ncbi:CPBP family intramembrane metalloprotease [Hwanghaeella grinnelliae]|uniref:CPBP family intramembrane metalloprotease n=1 Tax=Hwanghaeella grinnelliae TaxID=2500179 RepID=A0A437QHX9_9PROT|nr:CPBP family intramembrane glutamic endopeptidase [Hwanghaeella grinnelliae]RVU34147.1 CPBP family intramembrane metalloprotease [Hwanghaeella grinnelliae]